MDRQRAQKRNQKNAKQPKRKQKDINNKAQNDAAIMRQKQAKADAKKKNGKNNKKKKKQRVGGQQYI